jgi:hypothetical protein
MLFHHPHHKGNLVPPITQAGQWYWQCMQPAEATLSADGDALRCDITKVDGTDWHIQYMYIKDTLVEGRQYRIKFEAKASDDMVMNLSVLNDKDDRHSLGLDTKVALVKKWVPYEYTFVASQTDGKPDRCPLFMLGQATGTIWIRNLVVEEA